MKKQLFVLGMASVFALSGCHGLKKVEFKAFCDEVDKLESVEVVSVKITGKYDGTRVNLEYQWPTKSAGSLVDALVDVAADKYNEAEQAGISIAVSSKDPSMYTIAESSDYEYYTGMGFKVKSKEGQAEWNGKGLLASYKAKSDDHSCSFTFAWKK